jgi:hypothetical protein
MVSVMRSRSRGNSESARDKSTGRRNDDDSEAVPFWAVVLQDDNALRVRLKDASDELQEQLMLERISAWREALVKLRYQDRDF